MVDVRRRRRSNTITAVPMAPIATRQHLSPDVIQQQQQEEEEELSKMIDSHQNRNDDAEDDSEEDDRRNTRSSSSSAPIQIQPQRSSSSSILKTPVVGCILVTETAERFAYFGFRAVLVLYFTRELGYSEATAIALYGYHASFCYFTPLLGALLADGAWGRYRTIFTFGMMYALGLAVLASAAASATHDNTDHLSRQRWSSLGGLFLVGVGTGGIKPCVSAFGADQVAAAAAAASSVSTRCNHSSAESLVLLLESEQLVPTNEQERQQQNHGFGNEEQQSLSSHPNPPLPPLSSTVPLYTAEHHSHQNNNTNNDVRAFFNYFYFCINVGAVGSIAIVPLLRSQYGFGWAFGLPCLCMICAIGIFVSKRNSYVYHGRGKDDGGTMLRTFCITGILLRQKLVRNYPWLNRVCPGSAGADRAIVFSTESNGDCDSVMVAVESTESHPNSKRSNIVDNQQEWGSRNAISSTGSNGSWSRQQVSDAAQVLHTLPILAMFPIYWCLYDQQGSVWILQATRMGIPFGIQPEQLNIINPIQIMLMIPLFDQVIYPFFERRNWNVSPLRRMSWGMFLTATAFFMSGWVESTIQRHERQGLSPVHVAWQLPQITVLAVGEIFLSVTGLEFAYSTSPVRLKAFVAALFLCTTGVGDCFAGILYSTVFAHMDRAVVMHICGALMLGNLQCFHVVARSYDQANLATDDSMQCSQQKDVKAPTELTILTSPVLCGTVV